MGCTPGAVSQDPADYPVGAVRSHARTGRSPTTSPPSTRTSSRSWRTLFWGEAEKYQVLPLDASVATRLVAPRPSLTAGRNAVHLDRRDHRHAERRRAEHPQLVVQLQGRGRGPAGRRRGHDRHPGRSVRRLRLLPAEGQAGVPVELRRPEARRAGRARMRWRRASTRSSSTSSTTASGWARWPSTT